MYSQKLSWDFDQQALEFQKCPVTSSGPSELSTPAQDLLVSFYSPHFCSMWEGAHYTMETRHLPNKHQYVHSINSDPPNPFLLSKNSDCKN